MMKEILKGAALSFAERCHTQLGQLVHVYSEPTEEVAEKARRGGQVKLRTMAGGIATPMTGARARLEENYLFDTRRFAAGAVSAGSYLFFQSAVGAPGSNNGFPTTLVMSTVETNMDVPAQIAQGKDFVLNQIGISFNTDIDIADVTLMLEIGALKFSKQGGQYTLHHGPGSFWPGGMGAWGQQGSTANSNGVPDIRAVRKLAVPRVLRQKDTFNYAYDVPRGVRNLDNSTTITLGANIIMRVWLWGGQQDSIPQ